MRIKPPPQVLIALIIHHKLILYYVFTETGNTITHYPVNIFHSTGLMDHKFLFLTIFLTRVF